MTTSNLSGSLSEFNVAEVLALLAMGRRSARLEISADTGRGSIQLIDGQVSSATSDVTCAQLLRAVVTALPVGAADLGRAVETQDPIRDLIDSGTADRASVRDVATDQCTQAVAQMLGWDSGTFEVWVGSVDAGDVGLRLDCAALVDTARSHAQDWTELQAALPDAGSVLSLVPDVTTAPSVDTGQWAVLARVDGRRTLAEVLAATGVSPLTAGHRLADLLGSGLVRVRADSDETDRQQVEELIAGYETDEVVASQAQTQATAFEPVEAADHAVAPWPVVDEAVEQEAGVELGAWSEGWSDPAAGIPDVGVPAEPMISETVAAAESFPAAAEAFPAESFPAAAESFPAAAEAFTAEAFPEADERFPAAAEAVVDQAPEVGAAAGHVAPTFAEPSTPEAFTEGPLGGEPVVDAPMAEHLSPQEDPVAGLDEVGIEFAWSPWAQEMGLGEMAGEPASGSPDEPVMDAAAQPAEHTSDLPIPLAPAVGDSVHVAEFASETLSAPQHSMSPAPGMPAGTIPAHAAPAAAQPMSTSHAEAPVGDTPSHSRTMSESAAPVPEPRSEGLDPDDPLTDGLLGHLMQSVRGL